MALHFYVSLHVMLKKIVCVYLEISILYEKEINDQMYNYLQSISQFYFNTIYLYEVDSVFLTCKRKEKQLMNVNITFQCNVYVILTISIIKIHIAIITQCTK